eukprot:3507477-Prymnesium_polylepis.2
MCAANEKRRACTRAARRNHMTKRSPTQSDDGNRSEKSSHRRQSAPVVSSNQATKPYGESRAPTAGSAHAGNQAIRQSGKSDNQATSATIHLRQPRQHQTSVESPRRPSGNQAIKQSENQAASDIRRVTARETG